MSLFSKADGAGTGGAAANARRAARNGSGIVQSVLGETSRVEGMARFDGALRVDGVFDGSIEVGDTLTVGKSGTFVGEIRARAVVVCGTVRGTILASHSVEFQKGSRVEGDIHTRTLVVEEGVFFQGHCRMEETAEEQGEPPRLPKPRPAMAAPPPDLLEPDTEARALAGRSGTSAA